MIKFIDKQRLAVTSFLAASFEVVTSFLVASSVVVTSFPATSSVVVAASSLAVAASS